MKKILLILLFDAVVSTCFAQIHECRIDRRIYLWDVTRSMQGYDTGSPNDYNAEMDVWDQVVAFLKRDIENITDASTELIMLPFQEDILDCWSVKATTGGKNELIRKIDESKKRFQNTTLTNISGSFRIVKERHIDPCCNNMMILVTDGQNSRQFGGKEAWLQLLSTWQEYARVNNAYLVYFMVTEAAEDEAITRLVKNQDKSDIVSSTEVIPEFIDLYAEESVRFNITDDVASGIYIPLHSSKKGIPLPDNMLVSVKSPYDAKISIDRTVTVTDGMLHVEMPYSTDDLKAILDLQEEEHVPLTLELLNQDEIQAKYQQKIFLKSCTTDLLLINKIEKMLKISIKR